MVVTSLSLGRAASFAGDLDKAKIAAARLFRLFATVPKIDPTSDAGEKLVCVRACVLRVCVCVRVCVCAKGFCCLDTLPVITDSSLSPMSLTASLHSCRLHRTRL